MAKRMLIDATQAEETRVTVIDGNRLDELISKSPHGSVSKVIFILQK